MADHLTRVSDSFLGHTCSSVSGLIFHCDKMLERIDRCTEDLTLTWPDTSAEGWNLKRRAMRVDPCVMGAGVLLEHLLEKTEEIRVRRSGGGTV